MQDGKQQSPPPQVQDFHIVGVGASAGGLDAFKKFLGAVPQNSGMAYVLVQHLSPDYESILPEILSRETSLPVYEITDDINLAPDNVYIIPENKMVSTIDGVLKLSPREKTSKPNMPIDVFFNSLAEIHKSFAIGIVLSGSASDGTEGLKKIKEMGGSTFAQEPSTAAFESMPVSAVKANAVDFVLAPEQMPAQLQEVRHAYETNHAHFEEELSKSDGDIFRQILRILRLRTGNDFAHYKQATIRRRIARRMVVTKHDQPASYLSFLRADKNEQDALFNDVLIPVSYFFRDPKTFDSLTETVFPIIMKDKISGDKIRIWSAGCSTGEEAYSLAIVLHEFLTSNQYEEKVQIFASDVSEFSISKARTGTYTKQDLAHVSEARIQNYFTRSGNSYTVNKVIRDMCVFAVHNFVKDPPFAKLNLISCRNVMIYFDPVLQAKALTTFHYALKEHGILLLGKSETAANTTLFAPLVKNGKLYTRKSVPGHFIPPRVERSEFAADKFNASHKSVSLQTDFQKLAFDILFNKYTPAAVIVNEHKDIVYFHGDTSPYLRSSPGKPNFNLIKMAREGLDFELRNALLKAKTATDRVVTENIPIKNNEADFRGNIEIVSLNNGDELYFLVLFCKTIQPQIESEAGRSEADKKRIRQLEAELAQMRDDIRNVTESQEAAIEELQSTNEELLSSSEELQTLNEELETSSEELQSNNEELLSLNDELMDRQEQLSASRQYAEGIISTVRESLIILDKNLHVKSANASFYKKFSFSERDTEGKLFFDLGQGQWDTSELKELLTDVLPQHSKFENYELTASFPSVGTRSMLINARQIIGERNSDPLILVAIEDISQSKVYNLLKESEERFRVMADTAPVLIWVAGVDKRCYFLNKAWLDFTGKSLHEQLGNQWIGSIHPDDIGPLTAVYDEAFEQQAEFYAEYRVKRYDGQFQWVSGKGVPRFDPDGTFMGYIGGCMNIQDKKDLSDSLETLVNERTTELKRSQSFLQSILNSTHYGVASYQAIRDAKNKIVDFTIIYSNAEVPKNFGMTPEEVIGKTCREVYPGIFENGVFEKMVHTMESGVVEKYEVSVRRDREITWLTAAIEKVNDSVTITSKNVTEEKKAAIHLAEINVELERKNKELESFNYIASHDLQEPLRKIQLFYSRILEQDQQNLSEKSLDYFTSINSAADRMQKLIQALLSYSTANYSDMSLEKTDLNKLLDEVKSDLEDVIQVKGAIINADKLPKAKVIPFQFRQLLANLISNGIKYSRKDEPPVITITSEQTEENTSGGIHKFLKISIADNGIGFEQHYEHKIFELFQRLHGKTEFVGTGIGLAICKKIIDNHKGFIKVESEPGKGSVFMIYIPIKN